MPVVVMQIPQRGQRPTTRAELTSLGLTPAQADHELVRQSELEVIEASITRWVMLFGCIICALLPVSLVLFFYLIYSFIVEQWQDCDVPLDVWFYVAMFNIFYHINLGGRSIHRQVIRTVCRYQAPDASIEIPPARVRMYHWLTTIFVFSWHCVGLHWARISQSCHDTAPNLYTSTYLFASFNVIFTIFTVISTYGLQHMLASLLRRGLLPSSILGDRAAPEGTLELQQSVIFDPQEFGDSLQCPTCLEDFSKENTIKKTICSHYFHESCLAQWLKVNRTCPLCRQDLAESLEAGNTQLEEGIQNQTEGGVPPALIGAERQAQPEENATNEALAVVPVPEEAAFEEVARSPEVVVQANVRQR
mmetsp:Transcript_25427/g.60602  ORF Transcript_25427/g.60602 Transcript_25427/m.60602 type:complete len:362 (+) Transcript_25427:83-1168(+)